MYVSEFYKKIFGCKVYKISLDAGCTCPTRDGTKGTRGCIFCSASGSGDFAASRNKPVSQQIEEAKKLVEKKLSGRKDDGCSGGKYIAYFQNFTNTYGDPERLSALYEEAARAPDICGISIGTRPDCIDDKILSEISKLSDCRASAACSDYEAFQTKEPFLVSIELGLQTVNKKSAEFIRRGYELEEYFKAVEKIRKADSRIHIVTHVIFGLPGETEKDMMDTVRAVCETADGIKISCLHILKGTDLYDLWEKGQVPVLEEEEYYSLIGKALEIIPEDFIIHRLTGDGAKSILAAPMWTANKRKVHNELAKRFGIF
ncbi:MAG: TIGR01212 family radical SAM protein [Treponema sp.]|nr:TIGR01212 family radical SAM protein [Treponema sp.]